MTNTINISDNEMKSENALEKFYVYKSLHSDESWGAVVVSAQADLPNCHFLMKVFATNETQAIARGRDLYEKVHRFDSKRDNVRRFVAASIKSSLAYMLSTCLGDVEDEEKMKKITAAAAKIAMRTALDAEKEYEEYFNSLDI